MTIKSNFGRQAVWVGSALVGFALMLFRLSLVWTFGESLGSSPWESHIYGGTHVSLHVFGMLLAFAIYFFIVDNRKVFAALAAVGMLLAGAHGAAIGLISQNQLVAMDAVAQNDRRALRAYGAARMHLVNGRDLYAGPSASFDNSKAQRATFKKQEVEYQKRLDALRPLVVASAAVSADGQPALLAHISRWWSGAGDATITAENWQLLLAILVAIFPFEVTSFIFAGRIWRRDQQVAMSAEKPGS